ncbi:MAG TPA: DUF3014 domain-containing protein, partial [Elusimicrobiota bacterium]|nr:DUF3014 domain-containing protein [Elusimicrobiota bacterium]
MGIGAALLVVVIGAGIYFYKFAARVPPPVESESASEAAAPSAPPAAASGEALPPLQDSDAFIRGKAAYLSSDPLFGAWLKKDDLLARFAAAANMIGKGKVPKDALSFMAPQKRFKARKKGANFFATPGSYERYDPVARAVASIDAAAAAKLFQECKPLFQEAYQALGEKNGDVQVAVVGAVDELLKAPVLSAPPALTEKGLVYAYADDALESLSPAQKQLLRMGPKNESAIQAKAREFALDLGAPASS